VAAGGAVGDDDVANEVPGLRLGRLIHVVAAGSTSDPLSKLYSVQGSYNSGRWNRHSR
jgi:hypothetical protein